MEKQNQHFFADNIGNCSLKGRKGLYCSHVVPMSCVQHIPAVPIDVVQANRGAPNGKAWWTAAQLLCHEPTHINVKVYCNRKATEQLVWKMKSEVWTVNRPTFIVGLMMYCRPAKEIDAGVPDSKGLRSLLKQFFCLQSLFNIWILFNIWKQHETNPNIVDCLQYIDLLIVNWCELLICWLVYIGNSGLIMVGLGSDLKNPRRWRWWRNAWRSWLSASLRPGVSANWNQLQVK